MPRRFGQVAAALVLLAARSAAAQSADRDRVRVEADVDVVPFINKGFSAWAGLKPPGSERWTFGAGVFGFRQQAWLTKLLDPSNDGITVRKLVVTAVGRYFFQFDPLPSFGAADTSARGAFASVYLGYARKTVSADGASAALDELFFTVDLGYRYFPLGKVLFVQPSVGFESTPRLGGDPSLGARSYSEGVGEPIVFLAVGAQL
jgi:hypothetical protein